MPFACIAPPAFGMVSGYPIPVIAAHRLLITYRLALTLVIWHR
jgi:hypothetical protein